LQSQNLRPTNATTIGHSVNPPVPKYPKSAAMNHRPTNRTRIPYQAGHSPQAMPISVFFFAIKSPLIFERILIKIRDYLI